MQYTVRTFVEGKDARLDEMCRTFCSMERVAYNLLRDGARGGDVKLVLRERYGVKNARWCQSAINQARAVMVSQEEGIGFRIEQYKEKVRNTREKIGSLRNPLKVQGCEAKVLHLQSRIGELERQLDERSYPRATFGSKALLHRLSTSKGGGRRRDELLAEWRERRSDHLFSVGQANQRGNGNTRLLRDDDEDGFRLEFRNWFPDDFKVRLEVPENARDVLKGAMARAASFRLGTRGELLEGGLAYSVRFVRSSKGYQVLVSFELDEPDVEWSGRVAGVDVNPEGIACTIVSGNGNLVATRFFRDNRLITASRNKRKWVLEDTVNRMLRWCRDTHGCNAVAIEDLRFKGAHDFSPRTNFKLSNFMKRKMLKRIRLSALKMRMLTVGVNPAYTSMVAVARHGRRFGGFDRHQLAAFVIGRRALGYGEAPVFGCLPKSRRERTMWNHCVRYYGHQPLIQTLLHHEPMEWKSDGDANGGGAMTKPLTAPPATTSSKMGLSHSPSGGVIASEIASRRAGRVRPNGHDSRGDGARGYRVSPAPSRDGVASLLSRDTEDIVLW